MRGVTAALVGCWDNGLISTHTPHARRDRNAQHEYKGRLQFLLTRLMRGVTDLQYVGRRFLQFLLTRLMRGVTPSKR